MSRGAQWGLVAVWAVVYGLVRWCAVPLFADFFSIATTTAAFGQMLFLHYRRGRPQKRIGLVWMLLLWAPLQVALTLRYQPASATPESSAAHRSGPCPRVPVAHPPDECGADALRPSTLGTGFRSGATP
jgi:hypothetical protein